MTLQLMPFCRKLFRKFKIVIYFSIEGEPYRLIFVGHGLVAMFGKIDNAEASMPKGNILIHKITAVIRPPMSYRLRHSLENFQRRSLHRCNNPCNTAHSVKPSQASNGQQSP